MKLLKLSLASLLVSLVTTTSGYAHQHAVAAAIEKINQEFEMAMGASSAKRLAAIYTSDGMLLPPNSDFITGSDNIHTFWQSALNMGIGSAELDTVELNVTGDNAVEVGSYTLKAIDGNLIDSGKYIVIWKKVNGDWKYHHDMWSSSKQAQ